MHKHTLKLEERFVPPKNYLEALNPEQLQAVVSEDGPCMVIAGAGSGKTRIVTSRVAYLVDKGIPAERILLLTFTQKASKEMLCRVSSLINTDISKLWGGTFHHVGNRILRRCGQNIGLDPNYTILDREDAKDLLNIVREEVIAKKNKLFPKVDILGDIFSLSSSTRENLEKVIEKKYPHMQEFLPEIRKILKIYEKKKRNINAMDFDDLLVKLILLLNDNKETKEYYARLFRYILVDEYQDTNLLQEEILEKLASYYFNLMVVGDDFQSIYSFRGARFKNILEFPRKYPHAKIFTVEINYRSRPEILKFANYIISSSQYTFKRELKPIRKPGIKPIVVPARDVYQQASFLTQRIYELCEGGVPLNEMAILYRAHFHSMEVQMELVRRGIPFSVRSGLKFFEQAHIKDVIAYMKIIQNKKDELSWMRLLKYIPKIGKVTSSSIYQKISKSSYPLKLTVSDVKIPSLAKEGFNRFMKLLKKLDSEELWGNPSLMIQVILKENYSFYLEATYSDWERRVEDTEQLARLAQTYSSTEKLLSELALISGMRTEDIVRVAEQENKEEVILSTVHQAKGLEWRIVFVVWLLEGHFPFYKAKTEEEREEERRLFYVAITRAQDELYLTYPLISMKSNIPGALNSPSSFLSEVDPKTYEEWNLR